MFSLIVTLISIALVAALALATLYYGGPVFNQGAARAHAAKIAAQGQQIQGAAELYKADNGEYPTTLAELVAQNYLKSVPVAAAQEQVLLNNALAAASWVMVAPKTPVFALTGVSESVCKAVNLGSYGVEGILKTARQTNRVQCYGTSTGSLMIVQAKSPADLVAASTHPAAVIQVGAVLPAPIPAADSTDTSDAGWLVAPGEGESIVTPPAVPQLTYLDTSLAAIASLAFPVTTVGETSVSKSVVVKNTGSVSVTFSAQGATVPAPFNEVSDTCASATLAPNDSCVVSLTFTPTASETYSGAGYVVTLIPNGSTVGSTVNVAGTGVASAGLASCVAAEKAYSEGSYGGQPVYKDYFMPSGEIAGSIGSELNAHWGWINLVYTNRCAQDIVVGSDITVQALPAVGDTPLNSSSYVTEGGHPNLYVEGVGWNVPYAPSYPVGAINVMERNGVYAQVSPGYNYVKVSLTELDVVWDSPVASQTLYPDLRRIKVTLPLSNNNGATWTTATYEYVVNQNYTYNK